LACLDVGVRPCRAQRDTTALAGLLVSACPGQAVTVTIGPGDAQTLTGQVTLGELSGG
jgi:hypothetical protein